MGQLHLQYRSSTGARPGTESQCYFRIPFTFLLDEVRDLR